MTTGCEIPDCGRCAELRDMSAEELLRAYDNRGAEMAPRAEILRRLAGYQKVCA